MKISATFTLLYCLFFDTKVTSFPVTSSCPYAADQREERFAGPMINSGDRAEDAQAPIMVLTQDQGVLRAARSAVSALGQPASGLQHAFSPQEALNAVLAADEPPRLLILEDGASGNGIDELRVATADAFGATRSMVLSRDHAAALSPRAIRAAMRSLPAATPLAEDTEAIRLGLLQGQVSVRYQPIVRIRDGQPTGAEALARWEAPTERYSPESFVPIVESAGLGLDLSIAVARRAAQEFAMVRRSRRRGRNCRVSVNLPLAVLLQDDTAAWLGLILAKAGLPAHALALELTETTPVEDRSLLRRALLRLRRAGHEVLLDDLCLDDPRESLLDLPFGGVKLDRSVTAAMRHSHRARNMVRRVVRQADSAGMRVVAEGISDLGLWRAAAAAGVSHAQGYAVGRPMPAEVLPVWSRNWTQPRFNPARRFQAPG